MLTQGGHLWYNYDPAPCLCIFYGFVSVNDQCLHAHLLSQAYMDADHMDCSLPGSAVHGKFSGKNTGEGYHFLLQTIFPTQESK